MPVAPGTYVPSVTTGPVATPQVRTQNVDLSPLARGLQSVSNAAFDVAEQRREEDATAAALEADAALSDRLRSALYDPENGYLYTRGATASERYEALQEELTTASREMLEGLDPLARQKAEAAFRARMDRAQMSIDRHAADQRRVRIDLGYTARSQAAADDAVAGYADPETVERNLAIQRSVLLDQAEANGWDGAVTAQALKEQTSATLWAVAQRIGQDDPIAAQAFIDENRGRMTGAHLSAANAAFSDAAKVQRGRALGAEAYGAQQTPQQAIEALVQASMPRTITAESGGDAGAVRKDGVSTAGGLGGFTDPTWLDWYPRVFGAEAAALTREEQLAKKFDPETHRAVLEAFTRQNARLAYNAGDATTEGVWTVHFFGQGDGPKVLRADAATPLADVVDARSIEANAALQDQNGKPFAAWTVGDWRAFASRKVGDGMARILDEPDPKVRDAAVLEYKLRAAAEATREKAAHDAAVQQAFAHVEAGGAVDDLPLPVRQALGREEMSGLRSYQTTRATGTEPETDWGLYSDLSFMAARDPAAFLAQSPIQWRHRLNDADFRTFATLQRTMAEDRAKGGAQAASLATLLSTTKDLLKEAGIDVTPKAGKKDAARLAEFNRQMVEWADAFAADPANNGRKPSPLQIREQAASLLLEVESNTSWLPFNDLSTRVFELQTQESLDVADLVANGVTLGGEKIPASEVQRAFDTFVKVVGAPPTPDELIRMMMDARAQE